MWENGEIIRKWRGNGERITLHLLIYSVSLYFLPLYPFPISKIVSFCRKMLITALLSRMSQKNLTYALWENNSGSHSPRGSSASYAGLNTSKIPIFCRKKPLFNVNINKSNNINKFWVDNGRLWSDLGLIKNIPLDMFFSSINEHLVEYLQRGVSANPNIFLAVPIHCSGQK